MATKKTLWTVLVDHQPVAVVAAHRSEEAWRIVAALDDQGDLPRRRNEIEIARCPPRQTTKTVNLARTLGCADTFLACLGDSMFMIAIGGLSPQAVAGPLSERVA